MRTTAAPHRAPRAVRPPLAPRPPEAAGAQPPRAQMKGQMKGQSSVAAHEHCIALHYIPLHCFALHCIILHYIALHCITTRRLPTPLPTRHAAHAVSPPGTARGRSPLPTRHDAVHDPHSRHAPHPVAARSRPPSPLPPVAVSPHPTTHPPRPFWQGCAQHGHAHRHCTGSGGRRFGRRRRGIRLSRLARRGLRGRSRLRLR